MKQVYAIAYRIYTEAICNKMNLDSCFSRLDKEGDVIGLLTIVK